MIVNICGIPHKVIECEDNFNVDTHFGQIDYKACEIRINKDMATEAKEETICHEMVHGILVHLGYTEQSQDETFVQALGNAIYQGFKIKPKGHDCALWQPKVENHFIKTVTNAKEAENYPISEDISKNIEEINKLLFKNVRAESEVNNGND